MNASPARKTGVPLRTICGPPPIAATTPGQPGWRSSSTITLAPSRRLLRSARPPTDRVRPGPRRRAGSATEPPSLRDLDDGRDEVDVGSRGREREQDDRRRCRGPPAWSGRTRAVKSDAAPGRGAMFSAASGLAWTVDLPRAGEPSAPDVERPVGRHACARAVDVRRRRRAAPSASDARGRPVANEKKSPLTPAAVAVSRAGAASPSASRGRRASRSRARAPASSGRRAAARGGR